MIDPLSEQDDEGRVDFARVSALVVDDNVHMRTLMADILHAFGIGKVYSAADGSEALELMKTTLIEIVLCDWMMDKLNGIELLQEVRKPDTPVMYRNVAFILMTAHDDEEKLWRAKQLGAAAVLVKPFSSAALFEKILSSVEAQVRRSRLKQDRQTNSRQIDSGL